MAEFTFGIEEEYFVVDADTKRIAEKIPDTFFEEAETATGGRAAREFLQPQVEVITRPFHDLAEARAELRGLRSTVAEVAGKHGLAIMAAGTHPTALWGDTQQTDKIRYDEVMNDLQMIGRRDLLCGMHVHVELPEQIDRVDVMCRMLPYIPLLLALSTSSPFWQSQHTGLKGYRLAAYDELPRTGVPELFRNTADYDSYVAALVQAGVMKDASYVWWAIRPSLKHPTLELRAPDSCTLVEDSIAIAALYRTMVRHLALNASRNASIDVIGRSIVVENKWRAQRYGVHGTLVGEDGPLPVAEMLNRVVADMKDDVAALGCEDAIRRCYTIATGGTSADKQLTVFELHRKNHSRQEALKAVSDWLAQATLQ